MSILAHAWREYERVQLPPEATPEARLAVRRAFYSGAFVHRDLQRHIAQLAPADAEVQAATVDQEVDVFAATVHTELEGKV